jgi:hypothetical protein
MRPGLRVHRAYAKRCRLIRKQTAVVLAVAIAFGAASTVFPAAAAAAPPVVPSCTFPNTSGSDSCATLRVNAVAPPIGAPFEPVGVGFRARSRFSPSSSEVTRLILRFDDDIALNLSGIPACAPSEVSSRNIAQAYEQCGPGADGSPPSEGNAYLSPPDNVSGIWNSVPTPQFPQGLFACTMIFKGTDNTHLTIYLRSGFDINDPSDCNNPATNTAGGAVAVFNGTLSRQPAASAYDWTLRILNVHVPSTALDDLYATVRRGSAFRARCPAGTSPHRMQAIWDYTDAGDPNDTFVATDPCP